MRVLFIFSIIMFVAGGFAIVYGIRDSDALLTAMGAVCWAGMNFLELVMMKEELNDVKTRKHDE